VEYVNTEKSVVDVELELSTILEIFLNLILLVPTYQRFFAITLFNYIYVFKLKS
jgi:hypothetical protein